MISSQKLTIAKRLRLAGILLIIGLLIEAFSLLWNHPLSFIAFAGFGLFFLFCGVVVYLFTLLQYTAAEERARVEDHTTV
jgi:uncharacterized membrane protein